MKNKHFLKEVIDKLFIYKTPPKILEYVEKNKNDFLIKNPPYEVRS